MEARVSLDLSTLKVGDTIRHVSARPASDGAVVEGIGVDWVVARRSGLHSFRLQVPDDDEPYSADVPPPPRPITEPVTLYAYDDNGLGVGWASRTSGRTLVGRLAPAPITLYPPGAEIDGKRYVVRELDADGYPSPTDRELGLFAWGTT